MREEILVIWEALSTNYFALWFLAGVLGTLIYKYLAQGPADPFGEETEREMFWWIVFWGPCGLFMTIISWGDYIWELTRVPAWKKRKPVKTVYTPSWERTAFGIPKELHE